MKDIRQIREAHLVLEREDAEQKKLTTLVRAGLFDAKKLPMLKRALNKDASNMTPAEKNLLVDLLDSLMAQVLHSQQVYMKVRTNVAKKDMEELKEAADYLTKFDPRVKPGYNDRTDRQIPAVLILKRKAIRVYPDNQKVALYYAQALDQYVTIPFGLEDTSGPASIKEEVQLDEVTQELATQTYANRAARIEAIKKDEKLTSAQKAIAIAKEKEKLTKLSQRMRTNVASSKTGKQLRPWAGTDAVDTAKEAGKLQVKANTAPKKELKLASGWEGVGNLIGYGAGSAIAGTAKGAAKLARMGKAKMGLKEESDIKSRFKKKVQEKREEQLDEIAFAPVIAGAARLAGAAAPYIGRGIAGAGRLAGRGIRGAGRLVRRGAGAALGAMLGAGGGGDDKGPSAGEATAKSLGPVQAKEYQFQGGLAGGKMGAPGTRDVASATAQGDFRSPADQVKYLNAMMRESVNDIQVTFGEETVTINNSTAQKVLEVHNSLNEENKNKFETMLNESPASFRKAVNFALRY